MPEVKLHETLIAHTPEPEKIIAMASRTCSKLTPISSPNTAVGPSMVMM